MTDKEEAEANLFAMCLLIPEDMLRADLKRLGIIAFDIEEDAQIAKLAERYGVSQQLMVLRLVDLKLLRC